ncbi:Cupin domain protein [Paecilomyces variotii No. 5]|uniref:CENP-C homolog n=1 Tax=Byssochlamys spectabilis (strain No. 5 / NBRC 109023) TaxID=1356009 RepID=V5FHW1_BYSSN|nr:Cupin domain protein [Paecilomyces variotii No. 5]
MAPRAPVRARDYDYSNVGKAGRRTGITLKEGRRDEHGMEEIEGMFSSPEKSPIGLNGFAHDNESDNDSDGMSIDDGSAPGPGDFLAGASGRSSYFPPPVARSPMKTGLTGSPRRTPALRSSPIPRNDQPSSSPSTGRQLNNRTSDAGRHIRSPLSQRRPNAVPASRINGVNGKGKGKEIAFYPDTTADFSDGDGNGLLDGDENLGDMTEVQDIVNSSDGDENGEPIGGDENLEEDGPSDAEQDEEISEAELPAPVPEPAKPSKGAAAQRKAGAKNQSSQRGSKSNTAQADAASKRKRAGRPTQNQREEEEEEPAEQRPAKKSKATGPKNQGPKATGNAELDKVVENYANRTGPLKGRSLYILKRENPEQAATHTRSGRVSVRPLAYWRNERCVYGNEEAEVGERFPLTTIKEIIRTEDVEPEKRTGSKRKSKKSKSKSRRNADDESEDESQDNSDPWEKDGILHGYVRKWDPETQTTMEDDEVLDIAYGPAGIETRDVKDSTFRFAKLLSSPFLGSGIVELPPGGVKKPKNSKRMHMVFYVCHGRVQVDISGVQFSAGKGCVFQVPRGNYYSFANAYEKDARLFFTQGCIPTEGEAAAAAAESSKPATEEESPAGASTGRATNNAKGRPRGKQKAAAE